MLFHSRKLKFENFTIEMTRVENYGNSLIAGESVSLMTTPSKIVWNCSSLSLMTIGKETEGNSHAVRFNHSGDYIYYEM